MLPWAAALVGLGGGLALTNPGPAAFEEFAGARLATLLREELCQGDGLPLMLRLVIENCPALVDSQRPLLGRLARLQSRRRNLGLLSLYSTSLGGQKLLPQWSLPRYSALTLAIAGQFVVLRTSEATADGGTAHQAWLPGGGL
ncbi:MAG: DUF4359 domain-containing protein [Cyanobium sp.]